MSRYPIKEIVADYTVDPESIKRLFFKVNTANFERIAVPSVIMVLADVLETVKTNVPEKKQAIIAADIIFRVLMYLFATDDLITELQARTKQEKKQIQMS